MIAKHSVQTSYSVLAGDPAMGDPNGDARVHPVPQRSYQVVVAATSKMGIGKDGKLPWNLRSDLKFFQGAYNVYIRFWQKNAVVMSRKTWESIPLKYRPLPGRLNVVLTRSGSLDIATVENVVVCGSMLSVLKLLAESPHCLSTEKVLVIGGGQGANMRFNLRLSFPLLTTKRVFWRGVVEELLWFFSGSTNAKILKINPQKDIESFVATDFELIGYNSDQ